MTPVGVPETAVPGRQRRRDPRPEVAATWPAPQAPQYAAEDRVQWKPPRRAPRSTDPDKCFLVLSGTGCTHAPDPGRSAARRWPPPEAAAAREVTGRRG